MPLRVRLDGQHAAVTQVLAREDTNQGKVCTQHDTGGKLLAAVAVSKGLASHNATGESAHTLTRFRCGCTVRCCTIAANQSTETAPGLARMRAC